MRGVAYYMRTIDDSVIGYRRTSPFCSRLYRGGSKAGDEAPAAGREAFCFGLALASAVASGTAHGPERRCPLGHSCIRTEEEPRSPSYSPPHDIIS